ncbi:MAG: hypothetical protein PF508_00740 [Spirochaeta sp.]|nr:hypothetical protein [Spirochaeta sp.]
MGRVDRDAVLNRPTVGVECVEEYGEVTALGPGVPRSAGWRLSDELEERLFQWSVDCTVIDDDSDRELVAHVGRVGIFLYDAVRR